MRPFDTDLFVFLAILAAAVYLASVLQEAMTAEPEPEEPDDEMDDPFWLEIADAAEAFLTDDSNHARYRLERALEAVE